MHAPETNVIYKMAKKNLVKKIISLDPDTTYNWVSRIAALAVGLLVIVFLAYFSEFHHGFSRDPSVWGTFGDFIGGTLNPIFSFLGLMALLMTLILQQKSLELTKNELTLSREELSLTRTEMARSAQALEDTKQVMVRQGEIQAKQQFDSTLFSLLEQHNNLLASLTFGMGGSTSIISGVLSRLLIRVRDGRGVPGLEFSIFGPVLSYLKVLEQVVRFNGIYAERNTEHLESYMKEGSADFNEQMYADIIKAHIGIEAALVIALYGLVVDRIQGESVVKISVERYGMLDFIGFEDVFKYKVVYELLIHKYKSSAFGLEAL